MFRKELRLGEEVSYRIAEESKSSSSKPLFNTAKQTYKATALLLNYRVLDVANWLQAVESDSESVFPPGERRGRLPIQQLSNLVDL